MRCDNWLGVTGITGCGGKKATVTLDIVYDRYGISRDLLRLCDDCCKAIKRDIKRYDYKVTEAAYARQTD